jgi:hypothetical protein
MLIRAFSISRGHGAGGNFRPECVEILAILAGACLRRILLDVDEDEKLGSVLLEMVGEMEEYGYALDSGQKGADLSRRQSSPLTAAALLTRYTSHLLTRLFLL